MTIFFSSKERKKDIGKGEGEGKNNFESNKQNLN